MADGRLVDLIRDHRDGPMDNRYVRAHGHVVLDGAHTGPALRVVRFATQPSGLSFSTSSSSKQKLHGSFARRSSHAAGVVSIVKSAALTVFMLGKEQDGAADVVVVAVSVVYKPRLTRQ